MADTYLVISNPPHGEIDAKALGQELGVTAAEARMRANYAAPEIWFADVSVDELKRVATMLQRSGARTRLVKGTMLASVPKAEGLSAFAFEPERLVVTLTSGERFGLPYAARVILVAAKPKAEFGADRSRGNRSTVSLDLHGRFGASGMMAAQARDGVGGSGEEDEDPVVLELFFVGKAAVKRIQVSGREVDYSGLGEALQKSIKDNQLALVEQIKARFRQVNEDDRLIDVPVPKPARISGKSLTAVLAEIDATLRDADIRDLQARLVFLACL